MPSSYPLPIWGCVYVYILQFYFKHSTKVMMWLLSDEPCELLRDHQDKWKTTGLHKADTLGSLDFV